MKGKKPEGDVSIKNEAKNFASLMMKFFFYFFQKTHSRQHSACKMSRKKYDLSTLISLITVEVGINVEGVHKLQNQ